MRATSLDIPFIITISSIIIIITTTSGPGPNQVRHNTTTCKCVMARRVSILQVRVHAIMGCTLST